MVQVRGLEKSYGAERVLRGVDLDVRAGDLYGFLGQNGAGKTTAIKVLARLLRATAGEARLLGRDVLRSKPPSLFPDVGFLVETPAFFPHLTGTANLALHARLLGLEAPSAELGRVLDAVGLGAAGDRPVRQYSLGMTQRLGIAQALLGDPRLLILDEPTNGLDAGGIAEVRERLKEEARERGRTILLSSHLLTEVEATCNRVGVLAGGRTVAEGDVEELLGAGETTRLRVSDEAAARRVLAARDLPLEPDELSLHGGDETVAAAIGALADAGVAVYEATRERRTLEDVYHDLVREDGA
ncbi:MAG: ABC transporter ATP-binding protein [Planctomycetota bacterium JB042]